MTGFYNRALLGAAFVGYGISYGLAQTQTTQSSEKQSCGLDLGLVAPVLLAGAAINVVTALIGLSTQLVAAYNLHKQGQNVQPNKKPLLEMEVNSVE